MVAEKERHCCDALPTDPLHIEDVEERTEEVFFGKSEEDIVRWVVRELNRNGRDLF